MSSRLRSLDSKISFFAFADIITAVSGVLIFVALLLATDLGVPTDSRSSSPDPNQEQQIQEILAEQVAVDAQNQRLQDLLTTANTAPDAEKLQADIKRLKAQLAEEQKKQAALAGQISESEAAIAKRDAVLGLTWLKAQIQKENNDTAKIAAREVNINSEIAVLDQHILGLQSKLVQLRQREGKLWLIPEKSTTTKEPILATTAGSGIKLERFDQPENTRQFQISSARTDFEDFLNHLNGTREYIVFLVRPSGIALFQDLVKMAREKGIEVGFDALEEDKDVYFSTPPVLDETTPAVTSSNYSNGSGGYPTHPDGETIPWTNDGYGSATGRSTGEPANYGSAYGTTRGASGRATGTGSGTSTGSGASSTATPGTSDAAGSGTGMETGTGNGSKHSTNSAPDEKTNGAATPTANTAANSTKNDQAKTTNTPPKKSPPVAKSWWQRFVEWLKSLF